MPQEEREKTDNGEELQPQPGKDQAETPEEESEESFPASDAPSW